MDAENGAAVAEYLDERIADGDFPGAVFVMREDGREVLSVARGSAVVTPEMQHDAATVARHLAPSVLGHAYRWEWHLVVEPIDVDPEAD